MLEMKPPLATTRKHARNQSHMCWAQLSGQRQLDTHWHYKGNGPRWTMALDFIDFPQIPADLFKPRFTQDFCYNQTQSWLTYEAEWRVSIVLLMVSRGTCSHVRWLNDGRVHCLFFANQVAFGQSNMVDWRNWTVSTKTQVARIFHSLAGQSCKTPVKSSCPVTPNPFQLSLQGQASLPVPSTGTTCI